MRIEYLLILVLLGCTSSQTKKPISAKPNEPFRRVMASKDALLYNYTVGVNYPNGYLQAESDAAAWCQAKYKTGAVQRNPPQCGIYVNEDQQTQVCAVDFKCQ